MSESATPTMPPVVEPMTGKDDNAPYGRRPDGKPRTRPPSGTRRPAASAKPRPSTATARKDYEQPILGLFQLPAGVLAIAGMQRPVLAADAAAVSVHAPPIASALNDLAHERPEVAAVLDKVLQVGPYGIVLAAVMPLALQLLANHGGIPPGALGTTPPEKLLAQFVPEMPDPTLQNGSMPVGDAVST